MEQQQFKVRFSVTTKLLLSVVLLLVIIIAFLNLSTIFLVTEDKLAYTYQAQSTETVLVSREFLNMGKRSLDTLRLSLASFDPLKAVNAQQKAGLDSIIGNQTDVLAVQAGLLLTHSGEVKILTETRKSDTLKELEIDADDLKVSSELMKVMAPQLLKQSFTFLNVSKPGRPPLLGIALADLKLKNLQSGMPIAIAYVSLKQFGLEAKASHMTIADREGWVLFDSDPTVFFNKKNILDDPLYSTAVANQLSTGALEYDFQGTKFIGSYVRPGLDLIVLTRVEWRVAMKATYALAERYLLLGLMALAAAIVFAILFAKMLTAPINRLYQATKEVAGGNFNIALKSKAKDEIGALSDSFVMMSKKIQELIQESIRKVHLENELAIASTVQQTLIPPPSYRNDFVHIHSVYKSADQCGGDWWGFFGAKDKMAFMIADATGHGLPSALITASARSCFSVLHKLAQEDPEFSFSPGAMLAYANRVVFDAASGKIMMTFFAGVIDFSSKTFTFANAGHNPPWLFKKQEGRYALKSLVAQGQRLGEAFDVPPYEEKSIDITPDDILFMYTDGVLEGTNATGEMYGKTRVRKVVEAHVGSGPQGLVESLTKEFLVHNGEKPLDDDVTLAAARFLSPEVSTHGPENTAAMT